MERIAKHFVSALKRRLQSGIFTTEDSIRYTFFASLITVGGFSPEDIILEYDHPKLDRAKIDTWIPFYRNGPLALEFKYDRAIPSKRNSPRTMKAGKIFNDLRRLEMLDCRGMFIYVTDSEMVNYLRNKANSLHDFFELSVGETWLLTEDFFNNRNRTFSTASGDLVEMEAKCIVSESLPNNHFLKIYETISL